MPIEASSPDEQLVPPGYNPFCRVCRGVVMKQLRNRFPPCPGSQTHTANGRSARGQSSSRGRDFHRSLAFVQMRKRECPCYGSDYRIINELEDQWRAGMLPETGLRRTCWAGFTELSVPILVHDHLVGVAMSGQFAIKSHELVPVDKLVGDHPILAPHRDKLAHLQAILKGERAPQNAEEDYTAQFRIDEDDLNKRVQILRDNVSRIAAVATDRYRWIRERSETLFQRELLGRMDKDKTMSQFYRDVLPEMLDRMREFWAFKAAYFFARPRGQDTIYVLAAAGPEAQKTRFFGLPGIPLGIRVRLDHVQDHPFPYLYDSKDPHESRSPWVQEFVKYFLEKEEAAPLGIPLGRCYLTVFAPFAEELCAFSFAVRDEKAVSPLGPLEKGGISPLAQEIIFETCCRVVREFGEMAYRDARERAWREFSALASHHIGSQVHVAGMLLDVLARQITSDAAWRDKWGKKLPVMQESIQAAKSMLVQQRALMRDVSPERQEVDVFTLIDGAVRALMPPEATLEINASQRPFVASLDPKLIAQALHELTLNALRIAGNRVHIRVDMATEKTGESAGKPAQRRAAEQRLRITFSDDGPGIPPESLERVFDPFYTTTPGQTGLGLTTVRHIVEAHGGTIRAVREPKGARFLILIPLKGDQS